MKINYVRQVRHSYLTFHRMDMNIRSTMITFKTSTQYDFLSLEDLTSINLVLSQARRQTMSNT